MEYYFFRDKDNESNLLDEKTYHAAGYVEKLFCDIKTPNKNGKDLSVVFFEPFQGVFINAWRSLNEVELFKVEEWEYNQLLKNYKK